MRREDLTLIMLALASERSYTPVKIQKAMFLTDDLVHDVFDSDSKFDFQPYDYGPFDHTVYRTVEDLERQGLARIGTTSRGWKTYAATDEGIRRGQALFNGLGPDQQTTLQQISQFVQRLSFSDLVKAIYRAYPHMRDRSVFRD
jgi:uncharacterized protein YwgA